MQRWRKVLCSRNGNRYLLKLGVTLAMALSLSLENLVKLKPSPAEGQLYFLVGRIDTPAFLLCN